MRYVLTTVLTLCVLITSWSATAIEEPEYTVVQSWDDESIEIRDYESRILAFTDMSEGSNSGFRVLAGYIFGGNERQQEIARRHLSKAPCQPSPMLKWPSLFQASLI